MVVRQADGVSKSSPLQKVSISEMALLGDPSLGGDGLAESQIGDSLLANLPRSASNPGLFQGYAGIGYELLRLAAPESIPSVLLWE